MASGGVPQFASLYVGDLHPDVTEAMLYEIFNSVGPVASIRVCRDSVTRRSLGYGYINFHNVSDAERALDTLNYSSIKGRSCRIMWSQRDPSLRKSGAGNIYVKNLDKSIDNKALYDTFSLFGNILSCKVAADSTGKSYGYGFVHYETEEAAKQAIERVNGMQIGAKTVEVSQFVKRGDREKPDVTNYTNLYVKSFPDDWDETKINTEFGTFGSITSMALRTDTKGRKFAFVNFETSEMALKCVEELHMKELRTPEEIEKAKEEGKEEELGPDGHPIGKLYVQRMQPKAERLAELRDKFSTSKEPKQQGVNLYVKNLDENTDEAALRALFESFGAITSVATPTDDKGKCKGFGFVCFASPDEATKAVTEMHLKVVKGKPLYVGLAEKREARQERLRQRYSPGAGGIPGAGGPKGGKGGGKDCKGGMMPQMYGGGQGFQGPMPMAMGMMGKGGPQMMGMMPPQMMGMMPPQAAAMYGPRAAMMGPRGPMMGNPQMMGMMGKGPGMMPGKGGPGMMPGKGGPGMMGMTGMNPMGGPMAGPMGMVRPPMAAQMQMGGPRPGGPGMPGGPGGAAPGQQMQQQPPAQAMPGGPLNAAALAAAPPSVQKQMIGEKLFPAIAKYQPELAGKITGMMLEMDNSELLILLESEQQLKNKVEEALRVLETAKPA
eukprot:CAMPEP_0171071866 /NCGR_PEP_ID=MMETSP0766_2-20121228/10542_1 /TAXON_ID=439317 /ORGANISM="Gambierdiscus australes, Strain CAWD 149" /LENGTH=663 /DNA_ID=CAMNT_0011528419 /DNA_START=126 /DNA_END=2117 /DNA_ORIENTATION=+